MTQLICHIACYLVTKFLYTTLDHLKLYLYCYYFLKLFLCVIIITVYSKQYLLVAGNFWALQVRTIEVNGQNKHLASRGR